MPMCDCQNNGAGTESRIHTNEWELMKSVSSAASEVDWPAIGSFGDRSYGSIKCVFEVDRRSRTSFPIPRQRRQIFLFRLPMKSSGLLAIQQRTPFLADVVQEVVFAFPDRTSSRRRRISSCQAASAFSSRLSSKLSIRVLARSARSFSGNARAFLSNS